MHFGSLEFPACIAPCIQFTRQTLAITVIKLDEIQRSPDVFENIFIIVRSIIQGINLTCRSNYLPQLVKILNQAESFDFYNFFRLPSLFLHPYTPDRLNEYVLLDRLETVLCENWKMGAQDNNGRRGSLAIRQFAKEQLKAFLEEMEDHNQAFRTADEVKALLRNWLVDTLKANPINGFSFQSINLQDLVVPFRKIPLLETLTNGTFIAVDIACFPSFLQGWSLIDLSGFANLLGRFSILSWLLHKSFDDWIWGMMSVGYFFQFSRAIQELTQSKSGSNEAADAKWLLTVSVVECVYSLAVHQNRDQRLIVFLAFTAKSLGLAHFLLGPEISFFNKG